MEHKVARQDFLEAAGRAGLRLAAEPGAVVREATAPPGAGPE